MFQWGIFNSQSKFKFYSSLYWIKIVEKLWAKLVTAIHCTYIKLYVRNYNDICLKVYSLINKAISLWAVHLLTNKQYDTIQTKRLPPIKCGPFYLTYIFLRFKKKKRSVTNLIKFVHAALMPFYLFVVVCFFFAFNFFCVVWYYSELLLSLTFRKLSLVYPWFYFFFLHDSNNFFNVAFVWYQCSVSKPFSDITETLMS